MRSCLLVEGAWAPSHKCWQSQTLAPSPLASRLPLVASSLESSLRESSCDECEHSSSSAFFGVLGGAPGPYFVVSESTNALSLARSSGVALASALATASTKYSPLVMPRLHKLSAPASLDVMSSARCPS